MKPKNFIYYFYLMVLYMLKYVLATAIFISNVVLLTAQNECDALLEKAKKSHAKGDYADAFAKYRAVKLCAPNKVSEIEMLVAQLFADVNGERERAEQAQQVAEIALRQAKEEQAKNKRILSKIYFYENKLGLAYQNNRYGFIDKNGNTVIQFDYTTAYPFNELGFAYVEKSSSSKNNEKQWIDTLGQNYNLAENLAELKFSTQILDLSDVELDTLHDSIFNYTNIEVLYLRNIKHIPAGIANLSKLRILACEDCKFAALPTDIVVCEQMQKLILPKSSLDSLPSDISNWKSLQKIDLRNATKLKKLPQTLVALPNLRYLNLSEVANIQQLPADFDKLQELEYLNLHLFKLSKKDILALTKLSQLTYLNLNENNLADIPNDFFCNFPQLKKLYIGATQLTKMPNLECLDKLESLGIGYNPLKNITLNLVKLPRLEQIDLSMLDSLLVCNLGAAAPALRGVKLTSDSLNYIPEAIVNSPNLEWLELAKLRIKKFPTLAAADNIQQLNLLSMPLLADMQAIQDFKNLKLLDIAACPKAFEAPYNFLAGLENLVILRLYNNQIVKLPTSFGNLSKLTKLEFVGNQFTEIPVDFFSSCQKLTTLQLQDNKISRLPSEIEELTNLEYLNISHNKLTTIPASIGKLKRLRGLVLSYNPLEILPPTIGELTDLVSLRIDGCRLQTLPTELGYLQKLFYLSLNNMPQLTEIPPSFANLTNLYQCDINNTCLNNVPTITNLQKLRVLSLRNNDLPEAIKLRIKKELPLCKEIAF